MSHSVRRRVTVLGPLSLTKAHHGLEYIVLFSIVIYKLTAPTASTARQLLAGYWGQSLVHGNPEKPLKEVCQTTKYDILNVAFLHIFFDTGNQGKKRVVQGGSLA